MKECAWITVVILAFGVGVHVGNIHEVVKIDEVPQTNQIKIVDDRNEKGLPEYKTFIFARCYYNDIKQLKKNIDHWLLEFETNDIENCRNWDIK